MEEEEDKAEGYETKDLGLSNPSAGKWRKFGEVDGTSFERLEE